MDTHVDLSRGKDPIDFYVCQIENRFEIEVWKASPQVRDYTIPSSNWCAMTALRMALLADERPAPSLEDLFQNACTYGVYRPFADTSGWQGAFLLELPHFCCSYGFEARLERSQTPSDVVNWLRRGYYALPLVGPEVRFPRRTRAPKKRRGHFVFLYAYRIGERGTHLFTLNNSAGYASNNSQVAVEISKKRFKQVFSGDVLLLRSRFAL